MASFTWQSPVGRDGSVGALTGASPPCWPRCAEPRPDITLTSTDDTSEVEIENQIMARA